LNKHPELNPALSVSFLLLITVKKLSRFHCYGYQATQSAQILAQPSAAGEFKTNRLLPGLR
jgi:hypothetical protein